LDGAFSDSGIFFFLMNAVLFLKYIIARLSSIAANTARHSIHAAETVFRTELQQTRYRIL